MTRTERTIRLAQTLTGLSLAAILTCACGAADRGTAGTESTTSDGLQGAPECTATWDISERAMADAICHPEQDCNVCVQHTGSNGEAVAWSAQQNASHCPCPEATPRR